MSGEPQGRDEEGPSGGSQWDVSKFRHDARNQLNLIIGYIDLLHRTSASLDVEQHSYLQEIRTAAVSLSAMVDALRDH